MDDSMSQSQLLEQEELSKSLALFEGLGSRLKEVADLAALLSKSIKGNTRQKEKPGESESLRTEISGLKEKLGELQEAINQRNQSIYDITLQNSEILREISEFRKSSSEKIDKYDLLGKRTALNDEEPKDKGNQTEIEVVNKSVQVFRYCKTLGDQCDEGVKRRKDDVTRLGELIKLLTQGPELIQSKEKEVFSDPKGMVNTKFTSNEPNFNENAFDADKERSTRASATQKT